MTHKLSDICTIIKGDTGIMKAIPGEYAMITLGEENKTHNEYQFDAKAVIIPLVSSTGHGHASMKRVKYFEGKFSLGTILCAVIPKDETKINANYLHIYLHENREKLLVSLMKGAANVSLPITRLDNVEVVIPSMERQLEIVKLEETISKENEQLINKFENQSKLISQLRQSILQEAIQGKLTVEWRKQNPNIEPAEKLLKRIKTEKEKLIKEKKIKKEKTLLPISENEIPFELPEGWVWCRLGEIVRHNAGKTLHKGKNTGEFRNYITTSNVYWGFFELDKIKQIQIEDSELDRCTAEKGDLLICEGGDVGRSAIWDKDYSICFQNHIHRVRAYCNINIKYIFYHLKFLYFSKSILSYKKGMGIGNLSGTALSSIVLPLPPLSEQQAIVSKVEILLDKCTQLQTEIESLNIHSKNLLKALFNETFEKKIDGRKSGDNLKK
jgi:type I restriction enzyme S subunit